tara:strand:+ start:135 stop:740 length:606 start_codon:yes stop_codon:yes gene_type:complete
MNIAIAFVFMNMVWGVDPLPTKPGATWTFEKSDKGKIIQEKWEVVALPENFSGQIFEESEKGEMAPPRTLEVTAKTTGIVGINVDGKLRFLIRTLPDQQRLYMTPGWGQNFFTILFVIPHELQNGTSWTSFRGRFSCGVLIEEFKGKTSRMTWDSLPGKDGFRLSWKKGAESGTLDIVPGIGIVGMDLDVSFERWKKKRVE